MRHQKREKLPDGQMPATPKAQFLEFQKKKKVTVSNFLHTGPKKGVD